MCQMSCTFIHTKTSLAVLRTNSIVASLKARCSLDMFVRVGNGILQRFDEWDLCRFRRKVSTSWAVLPQIVGKCLKKRTNGQRFSEANNSKRNRNKRPALLFSTVKRPALKIHIYAPCAEHNVLHSSAYLAIQWPATASRWWSQHSFFADNRSSNSPTPEALVGSGRVWTKKLLSWSTRQPTPLPTALLCACMVFNQSQYSTNKILDYRMILRGWNSDNKWKAIEGFLEGFSTHSISTVCGGVAFFIEDEVAKVFDLQEFTLRLFSLSALQGNLLLSC